MVTTRAESLENNRSSVRCTRLKCGASSFSPFDEDWTLAEGRSRHFNSVRTSEKFYKNLSETDARIGQGVIFARLSCGFRSVFAPTKVKRGEETEKKKEIECMAWSPRNIYIYIHLTNARQREWCYNGLAQFGVVIYINSDAFLRYMIFVNRTSD